MVDAKKILSPKVLFPVVGVCVLVAVAALVAVFYVRNPTVADGLFNSTETSTSAEETSMDVTTIPTSHATGPTNVGAFAIDQQGQQSSAPGTGPSSGSSATVSTTVQTTQPAAPKPVETTTPFVKQVAIEPAKNEP